MQGSARKDVVFGAARVYTVTVPGPKWKSWLRGYAKIRPQSQRRVRRYGAFAVNNTVNSGRRYVEVSRQSIHTDPEWLHEVLKKDLTWMNWG